MPIEFDCEACQKKIRVPSEVAGQQARCPYCLHVQTVADHRDGQDFTSDPYRKAPPPISVAESLNPYASTSTVASGGFGYAERFNLARRSERFYGAVLDIIFNFACLVPALFVAALADNTNNPLLESISGILMLAGMVAYAAIQWTLIARTSQSIGKRLARTRIIRVNGTPPGFLHGVALRIWVLGAIQAITCLCAPVGALIYIVDSLVIFGDNRQCLHDMIASTLVVSDKVQDDESRFTRSVIEEAS